MHIRRYKFSATISPGGSEQHETAPIGTMLL